MGYKVKVQKISRARANSYYVNFPTATAEMMALEKGEEFEWLIEDKNTIVLKRMQKHKPLPLKSLKP